MKVLITGAYGQLGRELLRLDYGSSLLAVDIDELDITDFDAVARCMEEFRPDIVLNAAAYTAVDRAESDAEMAFAVNRDGPANLARMCGYIGSSLIHVSTDYVFDGKKQGAYVEEDAMSPLSVYGRSKAAGEEAVRVLCPKHVILRTSWLFSVHGNNFVKTIIRIGKKKKGLRIVSDQYGQPTSAHELAHAIDCVLSKLCNGDDIWGTYHVAQPEPTSWLKFAQAIVDTAYRQGILPSASRIEAIATRDYPTPAARPLNSVLERSRFEHTFGVKIRPWRDSLNQVIQELAIT